MTKNELAYKIGSQGMKSLSIKFLKYWVLGMIVTISLLVAMLSYSTVSKVKSKLIPAFRENLRVYASRPEKIKSKSYSVQSAKKTAEVSSFVTYEVQSSEMKSQGNRPIPFVVAYEYKEQFLQKVKSQNLVLEYFEGHAESPLHIYPDRSKWPEILDSMESDDLELYKNDISRMFLNESTPSDVKIPTASKDFDVEDYLALILIPAALFRVLFVQKKRRSIFLKNFKKEDLLKAEKCTIEKEKLIKFKTGNLIPAHGQVYKVLKHKEVYVIYNESKSKRANGFLLKYEDHYFFIHEKWVSKKSKVPKAA